MDPSGNVSKPLGRAVEGRAGQWRAGHDNHPPQNQDQHSTSIDQHINTNINTKDIWCDQNRCVCVCVSSRHLVDNGTEESVCSLGIASSRPVSTCYR